MPVAVERTHEVLVELVVVLELEFGADEGEVVVDAVALGREIEPIEIADALGVNQRRDRPPGDAAGPPIDIRPIRIQERDADDVHMALPLRMQSHLMLGGFEGRGVEAGRTPSTARSQREKTE